MTPGVGVWVDREDLYNSLLLGRVCKCVRDEETVIERALVAVPLYGGAFELPLCEAGGPEEVPDPGARNESVHRTSSAV